ncbi:MAG: STAS domain-containing protein [bacterium]|nr:STAS domain-containing protein [bacterium]
MKIERTESTSEAVITVVGEVDLYSSPELRTAILEAMPAASEQVAVDLSGVAYMDSSGVATLVEGLRSARKNEKSFSLIAPSPAVVKVLRLAKLDQVFEVSPTS